MALQWLSYTLRWLILAIVVSLGASDIPDVSQVVLKHEPITLSLADYTVTIITPLARQLPEVIDRLHEVHQQPEDFTQDPDDTNVYRWGKYREFNVSIIGLEEGDHVKKLFSKAPYYPHAPRENMLVIIGDDTTTCEQFKEFRTWNVTAANSWSTKGKPLTFVGVMRMNSTAQILNENEAQRQVQDGKTSHEYTQQPGTMSMANTLVSRNYHGLNARKAVLYYCVDQLRTRDNVIGMYNFMDPPLIHYCRTYALYHASFLTEEIDSKEYLLELLMAKKARSILLPDLREPQEELTGSAEDGVGFRGPFSLWNDPLYPAAVCGYHKLARFVLSHGAAIDGAGGVAGTSLQAASYHGHFNILEMLLKQGANPNTDRSRNFQFFSALTNAVKRSDMRTVQLLLEHGANVNYYKLNILGQGTTPLVAAIQTGNMEIIQMLLDNGAEINHKGPPENAGNSLLAAAVAKNYSILQHLLAYGKASYIKDRADALGQTLIQASRDGSEDVVRMLIDEGASLSSQRSHNTAVSQAAALGYHTIVRMLLKAGASPQLQQYEANSLLAVCSDVERNAARIRSRTSKENITFNSQDPTEVVRILLDYGSSTPVFLTTALTLASGHHLDIVKLLLEHGADVNGKGNIYSGTPLLSAISGEQVEIARILLERGALKEAFATDPQHVVEIVGEAVKVGQNEMVHLLLEHVANFTSIKTDIEKICLCEAAGNGHIELLKTLLRTKPDVNITVRPGEWPLHLAVTNGHHEIVRMLLVAGANPDLYEKRRPTILQSACSEGSETLVALLLEYGSDPNVCGEGSKGSALSMAAGEAQNESYVKTVRQLLAKGADTNLVCDLEGPPLYAVAGSKGQYAETITGILLENGADILKTTKFGHSALEAAAAAGNTWFVKLVIDQRLVHQPSIHGGTIGQAAMAIAVKVGNLEITRLLQAEGIKLENNVSDVLCGAAGLGHANTVQFITEKQTDISEADLALALRCAMLFNRYDVIKIFIEGKLIDFTGQTGSELLEDAISTQRHEVETMLRQAGAGSASSHDEL